MYHFPQEAYGMYVLLVCLLISVLIPAASLGETNLDVRADPDTFLQDETWMYTGYTYGGITFAIPKDSCSYELSEKDRTAGLVLLIGNNDYCLQIRKFDPEVLTYEQFKEIIQAEPTADVHIETRNGREALIYRNTAPNAYGELFGMAMTGMDGNTYKVSIFTGESEEYEEDAPVWKIAEIIGKTFTFRDFSEWGIPTTPDE